MKFEDVLKENIGVVATGTGDVQGLQHGFNNKVVRRKVGVHRTPISHVKKKKEKFSLRKSNILKKMVDES